MGREADYWRLLASTLKDTRFQWLIRRMLDNISIKVETGLGLKGVDWTIAISQDFQVNRIPYQWRISEVTLSNKQNGYPRNSSNYRRKQFLPCTHVVAVIEKRLDWRIWLVSSSQFSSKKVKLIIRPIFWPVIPNSEAYATFPSWSVCIIKDRYIQ